MQQSSALLLLFLITAAAAKSGGTEEGAQAPAPEPRAAAEAPTPSESLRRQYLPEDSLGDLAAGDAFPGQSGRWFPHVENTSDPRSWRDAFMKVYAASYLHLAHASDGLPPGPEHARDARNITDLKKWKARQEAAIKAFVPKEFKQAAREAVEGSFDRRASELEAEQEAATKQTSNPAVALPAFLAAAAGRPMKAETEVGSSGRYAAGRLPYVSRPNDPMAWKQVGGSGRYAAGRLPHVSRPKDPMAWKQAFMQEYAASYMEMLAAEESVARQHPNAPAHARDCHNISELRGWRHAQEARIKAFVPEEFQKMAAADVERKFEKRQAALADERARQPQQQARQRRKEAPSAGDAHSGKAADSKRDTASAKKQEERAEGGAYSGKAADSKQGTAGAKQEDPQSPTVLAALPRGRGAPLLAAVGLLASLATGALVARRRMQRTLDLGSYLLANEA